MQIEGWKYSNLGDEVVISSGVAPSTFELVENGIFPYIKVEDMNNCSKYQNKSRYYTFNESKKIPKGSVIFPKRGAAIMNNKVRIAATELYLDSNMMALTPKNNLDSEFLYYSLIREQLYKIADTSTIPQINNKHISPYKIFLPPIQEQKKIAEILSTWDKAIETVEKLVANSQQQKKALMQQLLTGQKRLLDDNGVKFGDEWHENILGNLCQITTGKLDANAMVSDGEYRFYTCAKEYYFIDKFAFDTEALLISGNGANVGYIHYYKGKFNAYQRTYVLDNWMENIIYIKYFLEMFLKKRINGGKNEGNTPYIVLSVLSEMPVLIPKIKEQQKIAQVLTLADREIDLYQQQLDKLKLEKKSLMQQLLTGQKRVKLDNQP